MNRCLPMFSQEKVGDFHIINITITIIPRLEDSKSKLSYKMAPPGAPQPSKRWTARIPAVPQPTNFVLGIVRMSMSETWSNTSRSVKGAKVWISCRLLIAYDFWPCFTVCELENHPFHRQFMNGPVYRSGHCGSAHLLTTLLHCIIACAIHHLVIQQPFLNKLHCLHVFTQHTPQKKQQVKANQTKSQRTNNQTSKQIKQYWSNGLR